MSDISYLKQLTNQGGSVYSVADMGKIWEIDNENYLRVLISRMVKRKDLEVITRGIYTYKNVWDKWELANKYKSPSYVSLESVLYRRGVIFQDYSNIITSVSTNTLKKSIDGVELRYSKLKMDILTNPLGVINDRGVMIAITERAACDIIYLSSNFYFDRKELFDTDLIKKISRIYNKRVIKEVEEICSK